MKIAFINIDDFSGGASIACKRIAKSVEQRGCEVDLFVQDSKIDKSGFVKLVGQGWFFTKLKWFNFVLERLYFFLYEKSKHVRFAFSPSIAGLDIVRRVNFEDYDVIHLHWVNFGYLSTASIQKLFALKKPMVWTMHDMWLFTGGCHHSGHCMAYEEECGNCVQYLRRPGKYDLSWKLLKEKKGKFKSGDNFTAVGCSQWLTESARSSSLLSQKKVVHIPNPIDTRLFFKYDRGVKSEPVLDGNKQYILFVAMKATVIWKGFPYFIEAIALLHKKIASTANVELLVVGEAKEEFAEWFPFKTHILGKVKTPERMNEVYNAADVFVIPSIRENLPNTVMEAMACGIPCVGFDVGGIPEMIEHKKTGYLAEYLNVEEFAEGIRWVLEHEDKPGLAKNCLRKVTEEYAMDVVGRQYESVYRKALGK